jgi:ATP-dependent Clp protease ATP-binding subunit ClpC
MQKMSIDLKTAFNIAKDTAFKFGDNHIKIEYVIYGILSSETEVRKYFKPIIWDYELMVSDVAALSKKISYGDYSLDKSDIIPLEDKLIRLLKKCTDKNSSDNKITPENFLLKSFDLDLVIHKLLSDYGIHERSINNMKTENDLFKFPNNKKEPLDLEDGEKTFLKKEAISIANYSTNLTDMAKSGLLSPVIGREDEINRVMQILSRQNKNNPMLIGEPGVGKTAIAEGLAIKIVSNDCPSILSKKVVLSLDLTSLVAGTKYRGQFEDRLNTIIKEVKSDKNIILFIDEMHTVVGAGNSSGGLDMANILKPSLARGELQCIGATTLDEYKKHIEKDGALDRRFQKVYVNAPDEVVTESILIGVKDRYEKHHNVIYPNNIISEIISLSSKYIKNRNFPDKALDIMDESGARVNLTVKKSNAISKLKDELNEVIKNKRDAVKIEDFKKATELKSLENNLKNKIKKEENQWDVNKNVTPKIITSDIIKSVVSDIAKIPLNNLNEDEFLDFLNLDKTLKKDIIGQDDAIEKLCYAIKRNKAKISSTERPIGSFLFIGSSGVGKTQLVKALANAIFKNESNIIRLDMSEYSEKINISRLIGAAPGYIGYEEGGLLTEQVKHNPNSIILLDEIEKAHPEIYNIFLQVLDDGRLTDSKGRVVDFKNTIIIMTSNVGANELKKGPSLIGYSGSKTDHDDYILNKAIDKKFPNEFINRLDEIIHFNKLTDDDIMNITDLNINKFIKKMQDNNYLVKITESTRKKLKDLVIGQDLGVRFINKIIRNELENKIADELLNSHLPNKAKIYVGYNQKDDKITIKIS